MTQQRAGSRLRRRGGTSIDVDSGTVLACAGETTYCFNPSVVSRLLRLRVKRVASVVILALVMLLPARSATADHPSYLILRLPAPPLPHQPTYHRYPGQGQAVSTSSYSYGWFGAHPSRRYWVRHYGFYGNYWEWSGK
jgi:hypothetical protein